MKRLLSLTLFALSVSNAFAKQFSPAIAQKITRPWLGSDFWANPQEDWQVRDGKLENTRSGGDRKVVLLTAELTDEVVPFTISVRINQQSKTTTTGYAGLEIGIQGRENDFRNSAVFGHGLIAGVDAKGFLFVGTPSQEDPILPLPVHDIRLELHGTPNSDGATYRLILRAYAADSKELVATCRRESVHSSWLRGLVAVAASSKPLPTTPILSTSRPAEFEATSRRGGGTNRFAFNNVVLAGDKVAEHPERAFGPILWTTYTLTNEGVLHLLVQGATFSREEDLQVILRLDNEKVFKAKLDPVSRTARFRVPNIDLSRDHSFATQLADGKWSGIIRKTPTPQRSLVVASFTGNKDTWFPNTPLIENTKAQNPDLLLFTGDQIYESVGGYGSVCDQKPNDRVMQCYLRKYALFGWVWRDLLAQIPSVILPDDHDVFHGNLWGANGIAADVSLHGCMNVQDSGGYKLSVESVNAIHRTQTGNLPDPVDPTPCPSGISVYFTQLEYGPFNLIILADRQFKSAPKGLLPEAKISNGWAQNKDFDPRTQADLPEAQLLGPRQEKFLAEWAKALPPDEPFRIVVSQSPWLAPQTLPKSARSDGCVPKLKVYSSDEYPPDDEPKADFDTDGWPQSKRTLALRLVRQAKAFHLNGDQHLGTCGQYGLDGYNDGPWWISSPSICNAWPRRWMPACEGKNRRAGDPKWLGEFIDGFGNKFTMHAVSNPRKDSRFPKRMYERAPGYTITRWNLTEGTVTLENWPYWAGPQRMAPDNRPYPGWPISVDLKTLQRK